MRTALLSHLAQHGKHNPDLHVLTADLGYKLFNDFIEACPGRFLNAGVAEQNMISFAAGMAQGGATVVVYSIIPFLTMRGFEQIRLDVAYAKANVIVIGVGAGYAYGENGTSHHSLEDIALMRSLPNMRIFQPADSLEALTCLDAAMAHKGPAYIRLARSGESALHQSQPTMEQIAQGMVLKEGTDWVLLSSGAITATALQCHQNMQTALLKESNSHGKLVSVPQIAPLSVEAVLNWTAQAKVVYTLEEHFAVGGLGSAIAQILSEHRPVPVLNLAPTHAYIEKCYDRAASLTQMGLDADSLTEKMLTFWRRHHA
jgi:transketolase